MHKLAEEWERRARKQFEAADREPTEASRRLLEHGAACYVNCALELQAGAYAIRFKIGTVEVAMSWGVAFILIGLTGMGVTALWI